MSQLTNSCLLVVNLRLVLAVVNLLIYVVSSVSRNCTRLFRFSSAVYTQVFLINYDDYPHITMAIL